jgi:hypothetical protein
VPHGMRTPETSGGYVVRRASHLAVTGDACLPRLHLVVQMVRYHQLRWLNNENQSSSFQRTKLQSYASRSIPTTKVAEASASYFSFIVVIMRNKRSGWSVVTSQRFLR